MCPFHGSMPYIVRRYISHTIGFSMRSITNCFSCNDLHMTCEPAINYTYLSCYSIYSHCVKHHSWDFERYNKKSEIKVCSSKSVKPHSLHDFCLVQLHMSCVNGYARTVSGLEGWGKWSGPFLHVTLISVWWIAPCRPSLSWPASSPERGLLKTDQWSSAKGLLRSDQGALLTFVCLTPNYDALRCKGVLMTLHVLNKWAAPSSKDHLQQCLKYAYRK